MKYNKLFFTIFLSCFLSIFMFTESKAQVIIQNFDNAVDSFFPNPSTSGVFFSSNPAAVFNLSNYPSDSYDGSGSMKIEYSVGYDVGGGWAVRTTYDAFNTNTLLPYIDLSSGKSLSLWYKVLEPANLTEAGTVTFEFKIAEFNDAGAREVWQYVTTLNLTDNSGNWEKLQIPLSQDADNTKGLVYQLGNGDGVLQLDKIKGFEIAISYQTTELSQNTPIAAGSLLLDDLQLMGSQDIYKVNTKTGNLERVTFISDADEYNPSFNNNGKMVAHDVVSPSDPLGQSIYITDVSSGVSTPLAGAEGGNDASWSPNGKYIAFDRIEAGNASVYIVPSEGGTRTLVRENAFDAEWSNNSKRLVFTNYPDFYLNTIDLKSGTETSLGVQGIHPSWSPNGKYVAYSNEINIFKIAVNEKGEPKGSPIQITHDGSYGSGIFNQQPSWSNNGKTISFHSNREKGDFDIWTITSSGGTPSLLTGNSVQGDYDPSYSKNEKYVAYAGFTAASSSLSKINFDKEAELVEYESASPTQYSLNQNYPNPFNPTTSVSYSIPSAGYVTLSIYDALGKEVAVLDNGFRTAGNYSHTFDASNLSSGMYFYTIRSGNFVQTKKMLLMK